MRAYPYVRGVELLFKYIITGGGRFSAFCDSHIRWCYFCVLFRQKLRRQQPSSFWINTAYGVYCFVRGSKVMHVYTIPKSRSRGKSRVKYMEKRK